MFIQISIFDRGIFWCHATLLNVASGAFETSEHRACMMVFGGAIFSRLSFGRGIKVVIRADGVTEQRVCIFDLRLHPRPDGQNGRVPQLNKGFVFFAKLHKRFTP